MFALNLVPGKSRDPSRFQTLEMKGRGLRAGTEGLGVS